MRSQMSRFGKRSRKWRPLTTQAQRSVDGQKGSLLKMMTLDNVLIKFKTNMADQRMDMFVHSPAPARKGKVPFAQACTG